MFQYLRSLGNLASSDLAGDLAAMGFYMSETIITSHTHARLLLARTHVRQTRAGKGTRQEQVALVGGSIASHAARRGSPLQGPRVGHGSQQAAINEGHHPLSKPTAHSQTHRTGEPRTRHHHPPSLSPAVLLAVSTSSAVEYVIA